MEQSQGNAYNNIVAVLMKNRECGVQEAMNETGERCRKLFDEVASHRDDPRHGLYVRGLLQWMIGNEQ